MQVRCVWIILNNQVRVNFSTNCKCRHIYLSFSDHQIPSIRLPQSAGNGISETLDFKISRGSMPPDPPRNLTPSALDFRAFCARKLVTKIPTSTPDVWAFCNPVNCSVNWFVCVDGCGWSWNYFPRRLQMGSKNHCWLSAGNKRWHDSYADPLKYLQKRYRTRERYTLPFFVTFDAPIILIKEGSIDLFSEHF